MKTSLLHLAAPALAVGYFIFGILWVTISDSVLFLMTGDAAIITELQTFKGLGFVGVTSALLYFVVARLLGKVATFQTENSNIANEERQILAILQDNVFTLGLDGRIRTANPMLERTLGKPESALRDHNMLEYIEPEDRPPGRHAIARIARGDAVDILLRAHTHRGPIPLLMHGVPMRDIRGAIVGIVAVARDQSRAVDAAKRARANLIGHEGQLSLIIEAIARFTEIRDAYTFGHERRVATLSCAIAEELGLDRDRIEGLRLAAIIHDIGKIAVPAEILTKPGRLSKAEMTIVRRHPTVAFDILKTIDLPWPIAEIVHQHHERMDGSGYPRELKSDDILIEARIMAVADVIEAMTSHRSYRPALGIEKAVAEITARRGSLYDEQVVDACLAVLRVHPDILSIATATGTGAESS